MNPQNTPEEIQKLNVKLREEIREKLTAIPFPFEELSKDAQIEVSGILKDLLHKCSLEKLAIDLPVYEQLVKQDYNLFSTTFVLNAIPKLSANDLNISTEEYLKLIQTSYQLGEIHKTHAKPIQEELQAEYQKKANAIQNVEMVQNVSEQKKKNKSVIPLKRMK